MGSCFSKSSRKRKRQELESPNLVQDKLVITQAPILPVSLSSTRQPLSPTPTSSSVSSFSCTNANPSTVSYSFTSSASSSSSSISRERYFSNEFLKSCVKENPHIIHNHVKPCSGSTPNKRARASAKSSTDFALARQKNFRRELEGPSSPSDFGLARHKSFRREIERPSSPHSLSRSALRSPSPSRRFPSAPKENVCKRPTLNKTIVANSSNPLARDNMKLRPSSPRHNLARDGAYSITRERCTYGIDSKTEELVEVGEVFASKQDHDGGSIPTEDIDNPLISLDCFIFL